MRILIADSGATKTDWCLVDGDKIIEHYTSNGISPVFQTKQEITELIKKHVFPVFEKWNPHAIYFYGSGCTLENIPIVEKALFYSFPIDKIIVYSDLVAAAHSLCGNEAGIACILGTGSNSCEWDGSKIVKQISPLGFILGDEGSGASMGKKLVSNALKNQLSEGLKDQLLDEYQLTQSIIIEKVYKHSFPSRFLASLSPFIKKHIADESIRSIVVESFNEFLTRNVIQYNYKLCSVNFIGSISWHYADILKESAISHNIKIGSIVQSPMDGLIKYYMK